MIKDKSRKNEPNTFIKKTYKLLSRSKNSSMVSWSSDGQSFVIKDQFQFTNVILPQYFKHKNFASFNRQLNMYGFKKTSETLLEFTHPLFQKNSEEDLWKIKRQVKKPVIEIVNTTEITERLKKFQNQQDNMETMLYTLESQYDKIVEQNQVLICELVQSKQREKNIESFIKHIGSKGKTLQKDLEKEANPDEFLKLSPLS